MQPQLEPEIIERLIAWAEPYSSVTELWLFGSRAKGTARPESDVDDPIVLSEPDDFSASYS